MSSVQSTIRNPQSAFTLVELMVAVGVTAIMIIAVARIFATASETVRKGMGVSEIIGNSRIVGDQIARDFEEMVGPDEGGVLIIVNQKITGVSVTPTDEEASFTQTMRSDQITFIRKRGDMEPITPTDANTFTNGTSTASFVRIWFGHPRRVADDGDHPDTELGTGSGPDRLAGNWIFGRQALFLDRDPSHANTNGGFYDADAENNAGTNNVLSAPISNPKLYHALTDVAEYGLVDEDLGPNTFGAVSGLETTPSGSNPPYNKSRRLWLGESASNYLSRAYDYTFAKKRLLVRTSLTSYDPWQIAQMHPRLSGNVSQIVIQFAGDYDGTAGVDENGDGSIRWYDMDNPPAGGFASSGTAQTPIHDNTGSGVAHADEGFVFRHGSGATNWPYMIRIRYRLLDSKFKISDKDGDPGRWFEQIMLVNRDG